MSSDLDSLIDSLPSNFTVHLAFLQQLRDAFALLEQLSAISVETAHPAIDSAAASSSLSQQHLDLLSKTAHTLVVLCQMESFPSSLHTTILSMIYSLLSLRPSTSSILPSPDIYFLLHLIQDLLALQPTRHSAHNQTTTAGQFSLSALNDLLIDVLTTFF